jgi:hypothetical protein
MKNKINKFKQFVNENNINTKQILFDVALFLVVLNNDW